MDMTNRLDGTRRPPRGEQPAAHGLRPAAVAQALWRRKWTILLMGLVVGLAAAVVLMSVPRSFTSTAQLLIDPRGLKVVDKDIAPQAREPDLSVSIIESEMRLVASDLVLQRVADKLGLGAEAEAQPASSALRALLAPLLAEIGRWRDGFKAAIGRLDTPMTGNQAAMQQLQRAIKITRQPNTYVIDLAVTSKDREQAAHIANAIVSEYVAARFDGRADASRKAGEAIDGRLDELRTKVREADAAVERYKERHGLASSAGRLLSEQRMGELSTQLQVARAETARAQARVDGIRAVRAGTAAAADNSVEALASPTLERLRTTQAAARQREAALLATLLPAHPLVKQARLEVQSVERSVALELDRISGTALAALQRARATEQGLERQLRELTQITAKDGAMLVELRELERVAEANRSIYQSFLVRTRELAEQQRIDPNIAMMLAAAVPAREANGPGILPLVGAASLAGLGLGAALALRKEARDPYLRSPLQLEALFAPESIHPVPIPAPRRLGVRLGGGGSSPLYFVAAPETPTAVAIDRLRRTLTAQRQRSNPLLLVVVAAEAYQGKSTIALNLAAAAARVGERVLLVDADRERSVATQDASASDKTGLAEVVEGKSTCAAAVLKLTEPPIDLMPAGRLAGLQPSRAALDRLGDTLLAPLAAYDVIIVDAARTGQDRVTDALAARADACLLVVQAGGARRQAVNEASAWLESTTGGDTHVVMVSPA